MSSHGLVLERRLASGAAKRGLVIGCVGVLLGVGPAFACELPPLAAVPVGKDVVGKQKGILEQVQRYHTAMAAYTDCIKQELTAAGGDDAPPLTKMLLVNRYNSAVAEVQAVLKMFDENVKPTPAREVPVPAHKFENGGADSAFQQFPNAGSPSSGQPRPPGN
jgi:hypothetical protein